MLERGGSISVQPTLTLPEPPKPSKKNNPDTFVETARRRMAVPKASKAKASDSSKLTVTDIRTMKHRAQQRQSAEIQREGQNVLKIQPFAEGMGKLPYEGQSSERLRYNGSSGKDVENV